MLICRLSDSSYQKQDFHKKEEKTFCEMGLRYSYKNASICEDNILLTNTHLDPLTISPEVLSQTKLMIHANSGYDNFGHAFVRDADFPIILGNPIRAQAVVEVILSALLQFTTPTSDQKDFLKDRSWNRKLLSERNILIFGYGEIGKKLEASLKTFNSSLTIIDPYQNMTPAIPENIDTVIMACSLNRKNEKIIDKNFLDKLSDDFILINTARGPLLDENALIQSLQEKPLANAFLDVFEQEPFNSKKFEGIPNLIKKSHQAGVFDHLNDHIIQFEKAVTEDFLELSLKAFKEKYHHLLLQNRIVNNELI